MEKPGEGVKEESQEDMPVLGQGSIERTPEL